MTPDFAHILLEKRRRPASRGQTVMHAVHDQASFDSLFHLLFHHQRKVAIRAAEAVVKVARKDPHYLEPHRQQLFSLLHTADHHDIKWHIADLISKLTLNATELEHVWNTLTYWVRNRNENKIVRANALQGLIDLSIANDALKADLADTITALEHEPIPSLQTKLRKLRKDAGH